MTVKIDGKVKLKEGDAFSDVYDFKKVLKDYVIQEGFHTKV